MDYFNRSFGLPVACGDDVEASRMKCDLRLVCRCSCFIYKLTGNVIDGKSLACPETADMQDAIYRVGVQTGSGVGGLNDLVMGG